MGIKKELDYRLREFDRVNSRFPAAQTLELVGAIVTGADAYERFTEGSVLQGIASLACSIVLAGASRTTVREQRRDYEYDNARY